MTRYRTIVADPPWDYPEGFALGPGHGVLEVRPLPYPPMTVEDIAEMPIRDLAEPKSRIFLWTTNRYLRDAFDVMDAWGFRYRQTLVWHKLDANLPASVAPNSAEFILVGTRGLPGRLTTLPSAVIATTRNGGHSTKPECWLDYFEQVSPGPYLELFARRQRLGWDTWGNEALPHVALEARCRARSMTVASPASERT
jgi:N6-adenosine-specific RNA methylase IME4